MLLYHNIKNDAIAYASAMQPSDGAITMDSPIPNSVGGTRSSAQLSERSKGI